MRELPVNIEDWPEDLRSAYEERAAILEFDAGLPRKAAERKARLLALLSLSRHPVEIG